MFTGLVEELGTVAGVVARRGEWRLEIACETVLAGTVVGDSIAVDGCCLTVHELSDRGFKAYLMPETLRVTTLGTLQPGERVNLERPLRADGRFGGHVVQGHVDGVGSVTAREEDDTGTTLTVAAPEAVARYLVPKGSVALAGVSLTVIDLPAEGTFRVGLIPHTRDVTTLGSLARGQQVNLEADVLAKYVDRLLARPPVS